jgi:hypothetical protein
MIDLTSGLDLSSTNIENKLRSNQPLFSNIKDNIIELETRLPNMMNTLWGYVCTFKCFPTQLEFVSHYKNVHYDTLKFLNIEAVTARLLRAYPSLTREIHFYSLAKESKKFTSVNYSMFEDVENGIDLQVELGGKVYNVSCFVNTKRSILFRQKKTHRHVEQLNAIEMPLDLASGKRIGEWILFDTNHVDILLGKIINFAWEHYHQHPLEILCS